MSYFTANFSLILRIYSTIQISEVHRNITIDDKSRPGLHFEIIVARYTRRQIANTEGRREQPAKLPLPVPCTHLAEVGVKTYTNR